MSREELSNASTVERYDDLCIVCVCVFFMFFGAFNE